MSAASVNDIHSELNPSVPHELVMASSIDDVRAAVASAASRGLPVAVAGGRHAMGGQQFCDGGMLLDTTRLSRLVALDRERGVVDVEAGIQWPALLQGLEALQDGAAGPWAFAQKQTGADRLSIGGAIAANVHGRGLAMRPFVSDIESMTLVDAAGDLRECSRVHAPELFSLVAGGYGLFGCVVSARLRLVPKRVVERIVEIESIENLPGRFASRIADGYLYGDFQFAIDPASDDFLRRGVFSCYRPVEHNGPVPPTKYSLTRDDWRRLLVLTHTDKAAAFEQYAEHYLRTSGQLYYSDRHQFADYEDGYHHALDAHLGGPKASEMISELYVPRGRLGDFMALVADDFRAHDVDVIYGTVRLIERDDESFLAWASDDWACIIFNLHTVHAPAAIERTIQAFRRLIDRASDLGGKYFLTYHRWATREQVERCYPQFAEFLRRKLAHDPDELFQSDWYRHYRAIFAGEVGR